jgi:peptidoglycan/LPS O-acetylase OafA/YrhL
VGFIRLFLASSVLVSHAWPLGLGKGNLLLNHTAGQTDVGTLAVYGFFILSGFLITGSGLRFSLPRFAWHRFLRIYPGLWVCLLVTALVFAPLVALHENGGTAGFWTSPGTGPFHYLRQDWWSGMRQYSISGLLRDTPGARTQGGVGVFDGSLWSLAYELLCYCLVGALAVTAVLKRAPRAVILLTVLAYLVIISDFVHGDGWAPQPAPRGALGPFPLVGGFVTQLLIYLGFLFLLGACVRLYQHRVPVHRAIAGAALVAFLVTGHYGGFFVIGLPAYAYLLFYAACRLPSWLHGVGRRRDYSYGLYIYAFPVQMITAMFNVQRYGVVVYILVSGVFSFALAILSWHLVEHQAMKLKDWTPRWRRGPGSTPGAPAVADASDADTLVLPRQRVAAGPVASTDHPLISPAP